MLSKDLKLTWNEGPDPKQFKINGLVPEAMLRTQRSRRIPKHEKSVISGILAEGEPHEFF